jgi:hypothetical protein
MPEETSKDVENIKKGMIDRRKKHWEEKEGPPTKKQKKLTAQQEERGWRHIDVICRLSDSFVLNFREERT